MGRAGAARLPLRGQAAAHDQRLRGTRALLTRFLAEASGLGDRLGVLLVQLPPSFAFETRPVRTFFDLLAVQFAGPVACEPRHASGFDARADRVLADLRVARVAADPARFPAAATRGGWLGPAGDGAGAVHYHRWHGWPRLYYSAYGDDWLVQRAGELRRWPAGADCWCTFDNTASGATAADALKLRDCLEARADAVDDRAADSLDLMD